MGVVPNFVGRNYVSLREYAYLCHTFKSETIMINRELIRLKLVQTVYAYYANPGRSVETTETELFHSLEQSHRLYLEMLSMMVSLNNIATRSIETQLARARRLGEHDTNISTRLMRNRFMAQLEENQQLEAYRVKAEAMTWLDEEDFLRRTVGQLFQKDFYIDYTATKDTTYEADRELWRKVYRNLLTNNDDLDEILENTNIYWNDDKTIVDTFVLKTIKRFGPDTTPEQELLPAFDSEEDRAYASNVLRTALGEQDRLRNLIGQQTKGWDLNRVALMDIVIMQVAMAEMMVCESIPTQVTINEYVEITKDYSTPKSYQYVNATLDAVSKQLTK